MQTVDKCQLPGCSQAQSADSAEQSLACLRKRHALMIPACARARHGWGTQGLSVLGRGGDMVSSAIHPALVPKQDHPCWPVQRGRNATHPSGVQAHTCTNVPTRLHALLLHTLPCYLISASTQCFHQDLELKIPWTGLLRLGEHLMLRPPPRTGRETWAMPRRWHSSAVSV